MCLSQSDDVFQAGPVHHALGRAQDAAAPPSVLRRGRGVDDTDQNTRTTRVLSAWLSVPSLCREAHQVPPAHFALLEGGLAKDWVCHQAGDAIVFKSNSELRPHI